MSALTNWLTEDNLQDLLPEDLDQDTAENDGMKLKGRERILGRLTINKHLFEGRHCARALHLQREMINNGSLLHDLGILMSSDHRLTAFMTCQLATAVLSSPAMDKGKAVSFLHGHLLDIRTVTRHAVQEKHTGGLANSLSHCKQNQRNDLGQRQTNQVAPMQDSEGQIDSDQVNLNPDHDSSQDYKGHVGSGHMSAQLHSGQRSMDHSHVSHDPVNASNVKSYRDQSKTRLGQVNHAVFTFDLCRLLLKKVSGGGGRQVKSEKTGTAQGSQRSVCRQAAHSVAEEGFGGRDSDRQTELQQLLCGDLPRLLQEFAVSLPADEPHRVHIDSNDAKDVILILASLLDLVHTLMKLRTAQQHCREFTTKLGTSLMHLFKDYRHDVIILKRLLDVFVLLIDHSTVTSCIPLSGQSHPSQHLAASSLEDASITTAASFVSMVAMGIFLEHIPYRTGPIGFGGGYFQFSSDNHDDACGDRPLLRKLYRATLCAVKTLLIKRPHSERIHDESDVKRCLENLWGYICSKLNSVIPSDAHIWIAFELFSDQDDSLVWVMNCSLDLYKASQSLLPSCHLTLNPHRIFWRFLDTVAYDPSVLLDLLISSETLFLEYLVSYLHTALGDWDLFCHSLQEVTTMDSKSHLPGSPDKTSIKPSVDERLYFAKCENSHGHSLQDQEEDSRSSTNAKRRKTEVDVDTDQETQSPQDKLDNPSSSHTTSSQTGAENLSHKSCKLTSAEDVKTSAQDSSKTLSTSPSKQTLEILGSQTNIVSRPLDDVMTTLIRLRFSIERISGSNLFPYPITPLLRLLERVEGLYEGNTAEDS